MVRDYKVVIISIYVEDLEVLDRTVERLKASGLTCANRSAVLRAALHQSSDKATRLLIESESVLRRRRSRKRGAKP